MQVLIAQADIGGFRTSVAELLAHQVHPAAIEWSALPPRTGAFDCMGQADGVAAAAAVIPRSFLREADLALLHSDPRRFDLLYRLVWRLVHEPRLKDDLADEDMRQVRRMAQEVLRDLLRLDGSVLFAPVDAVLCGWGAPAHFTSEAFALMRARGAPGTDFLFATPERSVLYRAGVFQHLRPVACKPSGPEDWRLLLAG
jgi:uracil-DNA glycosylase